MELGKDQNMITKSNDDNQLRRIRLILLGRSGAGKTSLVQRLIYNEFVFTTSTIGVDVETQSLNMNGETIKLHIWDTCGQERFHAMTPMYYRGANAALVVYDIRCRDSFQSAKEWVESLQEKAPPNITVALVGTKIDLANVRTVSFEEGEEYAREKNLLFMETSTKTGTNVADIFSAIAKKAIDRI